MAELAGKPGGTGILDGRRANYLVSGGRPGRGAAFSNGCCEKSNDRVANDRVARGSLDGVVIVAMLILEALGEIPPPRVEGSSKFSVFET